MKDNSFRPEPVPLEGGPSPQFCEASPDRVPRAKGQERPLCSLQGGTEEDWIRDHRGLQVQAWRAASEASIN